MMQAISTVVLFSADDLKKWPILAFDSSFVMGILFNISKWYTDTDLGDRDDGFWWVIIWGSLWGTPEYLKIFSSATKHL
jgi:hypothetical protein